MDQPIETVGSRFRKIEKIEVVRYEEPAKKNKSTFESSNPKKPVNIEDFDIKKARNEAMKLGMSGFYKYKRDKTMTTMAIELGAKPPKKKYKNYKDLQQLRKQQRTKREARLATLKESSNLSTLNHYKRKYARRKQDKAKKRDFDILNSYGKVKRS